MAKHVVVLGAGFAGLELTVSLTERLGDDVRVTLIDRNGGFHFGFSKFEVLFGRKSVDEIVYPYSRFRVEGAEFVQADITRIDAANRRVQTDVGTFDADILCIALGATYDHAATPGFIEGGHEFYSLEGAQRLAEVLPGFEGGSVLISVLGDPYKCPPAPFEFAFLLHDNVSARGIRKQTGIVLTGHMAAPVPVTREVSHRFLDEMAKRMIPYYAQTTVTEIDPTKQTAHLSDGTALPYDLFVGIPVHRAPDVVVNSGLAPDGFIPVDQASLATSFEGVYAIGDVSAVPMAKAGVFAESAARTVAADIEATLRGGTTDPYDGSGVCFLEFGGGRVAMVEANFLGGPAPTATFLGPTEEYAASKAEFERVRVERWFGG